MARNIDTVPNRRRREGKTHYGKRLRMLTGGHTRLVVRRSLQNTYAQLVQYSDEGDKVIATANTRELVKQYGWKLNGGNTMSGYLVGLLIAKKAREQKITDAVLDIGQTASTKGSRGHAVLKGAIAGGLQVPHSADILPSDDRVMGKHVEAYAPKAPKQTGTFARYQAAHIDPASVSRQVEEIKQQLMK